MVLNGLPPFYGSRALAAAVVGGCRAGRGDGCRTMGSGRPTPGVVGDTSGPTLGICAPNGAENDCNITGFDCSGLTLYAWGLQCVSLPHYSVYQYTLIQQIATSALLPGDLLFYATDTSNPSTIHHMAMYAGNGQMVQAPYSGAFVEISPVDFGNGFIGATRPGN